MNPHSRRDFLGRVTVGALGGALLSHRLRGAAEPVPADLFQPITALPRHHFFGYYDLNPWEHQGERLLAHSIGFHARMPEPHEPIQIGLVDPGTRRFTPFAESFGWNWHMGSRTQWMPAHCGRQVCYNDVADGQALTRIRDLDSGAVRTLPRPIWSISPDGRHGTSVNFGRLAKSITSDRLNGAVSVIGYVGAEDHTAGNLSPADDGLFLVDLESGRSRLIFSFADAIAFPDGGIVSDQPHWFSHAIFSPDGRRISFLHRVPKDANPRSVMAPHTRILTVDLDGKRPHCVANAAITHFEWRDPAMLLVWCYFDRRTEARRRHVLFRDLSPEFQEIAVGQLDADGHATFSPDKQWVITDQYVPERRVLLYDVRRDRAIELARLRGMDTIPASSALRCDFHPRFNRSATHVCIDSIHEGHRQMYVADVSRWTRS